MRKRKVVRFYREIQPGDSGLQQICGVRRGENVGNGRQRIHIQNQRVSE